MSVWLSVVVEVARFSFRRMEFRADSAHSGTGGFVLGTGGGVAGSGLGSLGGGGSGGGGTSDKEMRMLKQRVVDLEKENALLKKSLYELSVKFSGYVHAIANGGANPFSVDLDGLDDEALLVDSLVADEFAATAFVTASGPALGAASASVSTSASGPGPVSVAGGLSAATDAASSQIAHIVKKTNDASLDYADADIKTSTARDHRHFYLKHELKGHSGAIYAIQFSPCGKYVATGSFDKSVRVWEGPSTTLGQKEVAVLKRHTLNVSDVCWSEDSSQLLSGAYDQTCKTWDVENSKFLESFDCDGFVQSVMFNPSDKNQFYYGTTRCILGLTDRRKPENALSLRNGDAMINSIHVYKDNSYVLTADSMGYLKTWDIRTGKPVQSVLNEPTKKPISHIAVCPMTSVEDEPRYIGVNSYDNVMRVYDRGLLPPDTVPRMVHALKGYKNKNWPIKSSFHRLKEGGSSVKRTTSNDELYGKGDGEADSSYSDAVMLLATGSADPYVYLYSLNSNQGSNELVQRLEGHTDRVYATSFHPSEPILASCSADSTVKFWYSGKRKATRQV
ncbi:WD40-repeat-containing domain protein [Chytriomyces sp. MP71]|nr:WD40-repeat-containing domain protein [Chytriomyces sp. MP71]